MLSDDNLTAHLPAWHCVAHGCDLDADMYCRSGQHHIPVRNGIPRFTQSAYAEHFGAQWKRYRLTQLDSYTGLPISRDRLQRSLGPVTVSGAQVLECGCGAGRFTEILLRSGAIVTSIDLSDAVEANAESFPISRMHRVAQADIMALPFAPRQYDVVLCLGVIQHTPSPERTIAALYEHVRTGGWLVIDHYKPEPWRWFTKTAPFFRFFLKRQTPEKAMQATENLTRVLLPVHKAVARKPLLRAVWSRISPLLTHYVTYPELSDDLQYQWALLDTHDSLTDWHKHWRTTGQINRLLKQLGAIQIASEYAGNGVEARAQRPVD